MIDEFRRFRIIIEARDCAPSTEVPKCSRCIGGEAVALCEWVVQTRWWHEYPFSLCEECLVRDAAGGWVYFIRAGDAVKIGHSRDPQKRLKQLSTGSAEPLELWHRLPGDKQVERDLHKQFADERLNGEWFRVSDRIQEYVEAARHPLLRKPLA